MSNSGQPHRKRLRHYNIPGHLYELTFSCYRRMRLLTNDRWRTLLAESIDRACERHEYRLAAYVFMPEHVHLLVSSTQADYRIDALLKAIKQPTSHSVKRLLTVAKSPLLAKLTVRERPGKTCFRFWQEGGGYDRNLTKAGTVMAAIDYIHMNPVRRGMVQRALDWRWSSSRHYVDDANHPQLVPPTVHNLPIGLLNDTGVVPE